MYHVASDCPTVSELYNRKLNLNNAQSVLFVVAVPDCCWGSGSSFLLEEVDHHWSKHWLAGHLHYFKKLSKIFKSNRAEQSDCCLEGVPCWYPIHLAMLLYGDFHFKDSFSLLPGASRSSAALVVTATMKKVIRAARPDVVTQPHPDNWISCTILVISDLFWVL